MIEFLEWRKNNSFWLANATKIQYTNRNGYDIAEVLETSDDLVRILDNAMLNCIRLKFNEHFPFHEEFTVSINCT